MKRMRILYVTITNWGVGDELALRGALLVMDKVFPGHLKFFADKNPEIAPRSPVNSDTWRGQWAHSAIDVVVHAGGNSWTGSAYAQVEQFTIETRTPVIYLGVGMHNPNADEEHTRLVLAQSPLFIGRDHVATNTAQRLGAANAHKLCCPSLFIAPAVKVLGGAIGLVYQAQSAVLPHSCGNESLYEAEVALFRKILQRRDALLICHFIGDYVDAMRRFPEHEGRIVYSRVLDDYIRWYSQCGRIMSMRLHGAYLGATLGLPTMCLKKGVGKCCALGEIGVPVVHPREARSDRLTMFSVREQTQALKVKFWREYMRLLSGVQVGGARPR